MRKLRMSGFLVGKTDVRIVYGSHFGIRARPAFGLLPEAVDDYVDAENPVRSPFPARHSCRQAAPQALLASVCA
jgi:hypothetical protein